MSDVDFEPPTPFRENNCSPQLYRLRAFHEEKNNFKKQRKNSTAEDPFNLTPEQVKSDASQKDIKSRFGSFLLSFGILTKIFINYKFLHLKFKKLGQPGCLKINKNN